MISYATYEEVYIQETLTMYNNKKKVAHVCFVTFVLRGMICNYKVKALVGIIEVIILW